LVKRWFALLASTTVVPFEGLLYCVARDVTEHMKAQEALRENEDSLKESQRIAGLGKVVNYEDGHKEDLSG